MMILSCATTKSLNHGLVSIRSRCLTTLQHSTTRPLASCASSSLSSSVYHRGQWHRYNDYMSANSHSFHHQCSFSSQTEQPLQDYRQPHDVGGNKSSYGPIDPNKPNTDELLEWEQQCHALFAILASKHIIKTDELRRAIEALTLQQYQDWSYYEKWTAAMVTLLMMERKIITRDELIHALFGSDLASASCPPPEPLYNVGDAVRVKSYQPSSVSRSTDDKKSSSLLSFVEWKRPHLRTPGYIYGVAGEIERVCGRFGDPSVLAFAALLEGEENKSSPSAIVPDVQLYRVRFRQRDIWPEQYSHDESDGSDLVEVEIYEHWLEPATTTSGHSFEHEPLFDHTATIATHSHEHHDHEHHHHHHSHDQNDGQDLSGESRNSLEVRAATAEGPPRPGKELFQALRKLLLSKEIVTASELRTMIEKLDSAGKRLDGASLVVRAWTDKDFEQRLLENAPEAAKELGISTSNPNAPTVLTVVQNTPTVHNLIVCTLCSCYPSGLLGVAPRWYKSREYRSRAVREPRVVLRDEFGLNVPDSKTIRVHDSTADHRYLVLPERPLGTDGWSEEDLRTLVSRDSMVGVAVAKNPPEVSNSI